MVRQEVQAREVEDDAVDGAADHAVESGGDIAGAFGDTFIVSVGLIVLTLIPAFFLPRKKIASPLVEEDMDRAPIVMH